MVYRCGQSNVGGKTSTRNLRLLVELSPAPLSGAWLCSCGLSAALIALVRAASRSSHLRGGRHKGRPLVHPHQPCERFWSKH